MMKALPRKTALVTGASSGIGLELARNLAEGGYDLLLVARDAKRLEAVASELERAHGIRAQWRAKDLSRPGAAGDLWSDVAAAGVTIDVLVNNAGIGVYGNVVDQGEGDLETLTLLNVVALTSLTRLALSGMKARGSGRILNVGSIVGYQPGGPRMAAYYASKAYVVSFSRSLAVELEGTGVSVTVLSPGLTESQFEDRSGIAGTWLSRLVPKLTAATVARAGYRAMEKGRRSVIPGFIPKLLAIAGELPPRGIALQVNRFLLKAACA